MNDLDFSFEDSPWERYLRQLEDNDTVSASFLLTLMEGEDEDAVEDAFQALEDLNAELDISDLPRAAFSGETGVRLRQEMEFAKRGMPFRELAETDPLRLYLEELTQLPAGGDIQRIAAELGRANRDREDAERARMALVNLSLNRVVELAGAYVGRGVLLLDLIQEGSIGLWKATECFVGLGEDFGHTRDRWIRFYMAKAVIQQARANGVGQKMRQALEDYQAVDERLLGELGRNPTLEEIALELHMSPEEAAAVKQTLDDARLLARAEKPAEPEEEKEAEQQAVEDTAYFQMRQRILELLSALSEDDARLLTLRFGLEGGLPLSPEDTGRRLGLTPQEVVAREAAALAKLRTGQ